MQVAFVVLLDPPAYNYMRNIQIKLCNLFGAKETLKLEPHSTLKYPFDTNDITSVEHYFDKLVGQTKEFEIVLNNVRSFPTNVAYIEVQKNDVLDKLHFKILKDLSDTFSVKLSNFEGKDFHPHVTLADRNIADETFHKIMDYLKDETPNFTCRIKRLGMYVSLHPDQNWFIYKIGNLT